MIILILNSFSSKNQIIHKLQKKKYFYIQFINTLQLFLILLIFLIKK